MSRIVIALGGNALGDSPAEQIAKIAAAVPPLVELVAQGHQIVVTHGNGPQVGIVSTAFEESAATDPRIPLLDLAECTAMTQGYIGYHLQQGLATELGRQGVPSSVTTVVTQVEVDPRDPAFANPTKPIGMFLDEATAQHLMAEDPARVYREDSGRGWRRMVASPRPIDIVERQAILHLVDAGFLVLACGGGGIPVVREDSGYRGVSAVVDKDLATARLAQLVDAERMLILTTVNAVSLDWGTPEQRELRQVRVEDLEGHVRQGHFAPGSMLPKVQAAIDFVRSGPGREAIICALGDAAAALQGTAGTRVTA